MFMIRLYFHFDVYNFSTKIKSSGVKGKKKGEGTYLESENEKSSLDETKRDCTRRRK